MNTLQFLLPLAWRNLWRNKRRTIIILAAISVGVWAMVFFNAFLAAWLASSLRESIITLTGHAQIHAPHYLDDPSIEHRLSPLAEPLITLLNSPVVAAWSQRVRVPAVLMSAHATTPVTLVGIIPESERDLSFIATATKMGNYLSSSQDKGILLGAKLAERLETGLGKRVVLMSQGVDGSITERGFPIRGIFTASQEATETAWVFIGIQTAQQMLKMNQDCSEIALVLRNIQQLPTFLPQLQQVASTLDVATWQTLQPLTQALFQMSEGVTGLLVIIMFVAMAFGIVNTLLMAVFERVRELGLLQALGMRPGLILGQVLLESALLIGLGVLTGIMLGSATILAFHSGIDLSRFASAVAYWGAEKVLYPQLNYSDLLFIGGLVWFLGIIVSCYPAWQATQYTPVIAMNRST
jgi:ABC-type lipoprotein release transport system permease subunit